MKTPKRWADLGPEQLGWRVLAFFWGEGWVVEDFGGSCLLSEVSRRGRI